MLASVALLTGVGPGVFAPSEMSAVRSVVPDERLATALSRIQAREQAAALSEPRSRTPHGMGSYRMALTPDRLQGGVSAARFLSMSTMPLASVVGGALMGWLGGSAAIAAPGVMTGVALIVTVSRSVRRIPRPVVWQEQLREAAADNLVARDGSRGHRRP